MLFVADAKATCHLFIILLVERNPGGVFDNKYNVRESLLEKNRVMDDISFSNTCRWPLVKYMPRKVFQAANLSGYGLYITGNITLVLNK